MTDTPSVTISTTMFYSTSIVYIDLCSDSNPSFVYYLNQVPIVICKGTSNFLIQVSHSKFIFMKMLWSYICGELMRFLPKGLKRLKIHTRFKLDFLLNFIIQNVERFRSWAKKEICSI
jgi:hypothetical protein